MNLLLGLLLLACLLFPAGAAAAPHTAAETGGSSKSRKAPLSKQNFVAVRGGQATLTIVKIVRNSSAKSSPILLVLT